MFHWLISIVLICLFSYFLYNRITIHTIRKFFLPALILKLFCGILVGVIYIYHYQSGDTLWYHEMSVVLFEWGRNNLNLFFQFLFNSDLFPEMLDKLGYDGDQRSLFFIKILSVLNFISGGNYWINSMYLSALAFAGSWMAVNAISAFVSNKNYSGLTAFVFFPTVIFWSSGVLKESISMFCFGILIYIFLEGYYTKKWTAVKLIVFLAVFVIYWGIKYHYAAILICTMITIFIASATSRYFKKMTSLPVFTILFLAIAGILSVTHPNFSLKGFFDLLYSNHVTIQQISEGKNLIPFISFQDPIAGFMINIPNALTAGLFMPLPFQATGILGFTTGVLNLAILILFIGKIYHSGKFPEGESRLVFYGAIYYILVLSVIMAYSSPNFGTLERYKTSYLPLFLFIIFNNNKLVTRIISYLSFRNLSGSKKNTT